MAVNRKAENNQTKAARELYLNSATLLHASRLPSDQILGTIGAQVGAVTAFLHDFERRGVELSNERAWQFLNETIDLTAETLRTIVQSPALGFSDVDDLSIFGAAGVAASRAAERTFSSFQDIFEGDDAQRILTDLDDAVRSITRQIEERGVTRSLMDHPASSAVRAIDCSRRFARRNPDTKVAAIAIAIDTFATGTLAAIDLRTHGAFPWHVQDRVDETLQAALSELPLNPLTVTDRFLGGSDGGRFSGESLRALGTTLALIVHETSTSPAELDSEDADLASIAAGHELTVDDLTAKCDRIVDAFNASDKTLAILDAPGLIF